MTSDRSRIKQSLYFLLTVVSIVVTAYHSAGPLHPDEYFQIIEFASYKLGITALEQLPWEYAAAIRPWFQPFVALLPMTLGESLNLPRSLSYFLIQLTFALIMLSSLYFFLHHARPFLSDSARKWLKNCYFLVYFVPFLAVRTASESFCFSLALFALGFCARDLESPTRRFPQFMAGFFWGLSFLARMQAVAFFTGYLLWLLHSQGLKRRTCLSFAILGFSSAFVFGIFLDRIGYGSWVLTSYNYFKFNILEGGAQQFGTEPVSFFLFEFARSAILKPLEAIAILSAFAFFFWHRTHLFTFIFLAFFIVNSIPAHKEPRFIFPLFLFLPFFFFEALQKMLTTWPSLKTKTWWHIIIVLVVLLNFNTLIKRSFSAMREAFTIIRVAETVSQHELCLAGWEGDLFVYTNLQLSFLKSQNLPKIMQQSHCLPNMPSILFKKRDDTEQLDPITTEKLRKYCRSTYTEPWWQAIVPQWLAARTQIWSCSL